MFGNKKTCGRCKETKSTEEFYGDKARNDRLKSWCKECSKEYGRSELGKNALRKYRDSQKGKENQKRYHQSEKGRKTDSIYAKTDISKDINKRYRQSEKGKVATNNRKIRYNKKYPHRTKAKSAVMGAVSSDKLPRIITQLCTDCGKQAEHYHHESYEKKDWLNVVPLCVLCHKQRHM